VNEIGNESGISREKLNW